MKTPKHILIIRLSAMGDIAIAVPVIYAFAKAYTETKITVLTKPFFAPILETLPNVTVLTADVKDTHKGILGLRKLARSLKNQQIDAVVDLHNVLRSKILTFFLGLPVARIDKGRAAKKRLIQGKEFKQLKTTSNRYVEVFKDLGFDNIHPEVIERPEQLKTVAQFVAGNTKRWVGIAPFAAHQGKQYPQALMKAVLEQLDTLDRIQLILFGAPTEREQLEALAQDCKNTSIVAGKRSFSEELNLIGQLDVMIAMDSGNAHLAAMYGVPTITLWGVTHPYAGFAPFGQEAHCMVSDREQYPAIPTSIYGNTLPQGYEKAMETIQPNMIVDKVKALLVL